MITNVNRYTFLKWNNFFLHFPNHSFEKKKIDIIRWKCKERPFGLWLEVTSTRGYFYFRIRPKIRQGFSSLAAILEMAVVQRWLLQFTFEDFYSQNFARKMVGNDPKMVGKAFSIIILNANNLNSNFKAYFLRYCIHFLNKKWR